MNVPFDQCSVDESALDESVVSPICMLDISPYTKSEEPRVAGKHLTRHAKNGYAAVAIQQVTGQFAQKFDFFC